MATMAETTLMMELFGPEAATRTKAAQRRGYYARQGLRHNLRSRYACPHKRRLRPAVVARDSAALGRGNGEMHLKNGTILSG